LESPCSLKSGSEAELEARNCETLIESALKLSGGPVVDAIKLFLLVVYDVLDKVPCTALLNSGNAN
jgi:hypothetical protein